MKPVPKESTIGGILSAAVAGGGRFLAGPLMLRPRAMPMGCPVSSAGASAGSQDCGGETRPMGPEEEEEDMSIAVDGLPSFIASAAAFWLIVRRGGVHIPGSREYELGEKLKFRGGGMLGRLSWERSGYSSGSDVCGGLDNIGQVVESGVGGAAGMPKSNLKPVSMTGLGSGCCLLIEPGDDSETGLSPLVRAS
jgi:hypothetical protein